MPWSLCVYSMITITKPLLFMKHTLYTRELHRVMCSLVTIALRALFKTISWSLTLSKVRSRSTGTLLFSMGQRKATDEIHFQPHEVQRHWPEWCVCLFRNMWIWWVRGDWCSMAQMQVVEYNWFLMGWLPATRCSSIRYALKTNTAAYFLLALQWRMYCYTVSVISA